MARLVVLEALPTKDFSFGLRRAWDDGDAVLPLDPRLPPLAREAVLAAARPHDPVEDGDALVVFTSGTTGEPKGVVLTREAVEASARATSSRLGIDPRRDKWLACLPLAHVGGLSVVTRALCTGTPLLAKPRADRASVAAGVAAGCTRVALVPAVLDRVDVTPFRTVLLGGSTMPDRLPPNAVTTYGMTETGSGVVYDGVPLDGVEVRVVEGEIQVRGPMLLRAYRDGTDPKDPDGWFPTGDAGTWGPPSDHPTAAPRGFGGVAAESGSPLGRLTVHGRIGDVIRTGGEMVWPTAVEKALLRHSAVAEALVFGRPDPQWGHRVVARIVPVDPADPPTLDTLRHWVKETLPSWAAPKELELAAALSRTPNGKLRRPTDERT